MYELYKESHQKGYIENEEDFIARILENRNLPLDYDFYPEKEFDYQLLDNIVQAAETLLKELNKTNAQLAVLIDSDIDGYTSSAMLVSYIKKLYPKTTVHLLSHTGKEHGLTSDIIKDLSKLKKKNPELSCLIIPDAATNDIEAHGTVSELGYDTIILDHHEYNEAIKEALKSKSREEVWSNVILVNNQTCDYPNKSLSGAGIVYKFLQALDDINGYEMAEYYLDLVALGNIADVMNLSSSETRALVYKGLEYQNRNNRFLKELIYKNISDYKRVYPHSMSFNVIPKINGMIRIGSAKDKTALFEALVDTEERTEINSRTGKEETIPQKMTRLCTNAHGRQKNLKKKISKEINEIIATNNLTENPFLLVPVDASFKRELTGYIAGSLASEYRRPTLIMVKSEKDKFTGSLRGYESVIPDTKEFLNSLGLFNHVTGHPNAAGFSIDESNVKLLSKKIKEKLSDSVAEKVKVDFVIDKDELTTDIVEDIYDLECLWGKGIDTPTFGMSLKVNTANIKQSASSSMISWYEGDIKFVQYVSGKEMQNAIANLQTVEIDLIGTIAVSSFLGKVSHQFTISDLQITKVHKTENTFGSMAVEEGELDIDNLFG